MSPDEVVVRERAGWRDSLAAVEAAVVFLMIMAYIWKLRYSYPKLWIPMLALVFASHAWHRENAESLGFVKRNLRECLREFSPVLVLLALALLGAGMVLDTTRPISFDQGVITLMGYYPWGLFQQYLLNGFFMNRLQVAAPRRLAPLAAATLFAGAHLPNWFLMLVTFLAGYCCACIYRKYKNLYFLGLAHAAIGFLLYLVVPDWLSHHLNVGPGWFRY